MTTLMAPNHGASELGSSLAQGADSVGVPYRSLLLAHGRANAERPLMDPIELLTRQHEEAEALFQRVAVARGEEKDHLFRRLAWLLTLHAQLEERVFYPEVKLAETSDLIQHSYDDHAEARALISEMLQLHVGDMRFEPSLVRLRTSVEAHVAEEQSVLFPQVRRLLSAERRARLGGELARLRDELSQPGGLPTVSSEPGLGAP